MCQGHFLSPSLRLFLCLMHLLHLNSLLIWIRSSMLSPSLMLLNGLKWSSVMIICTNENTKHMDESCDLLCWEQGKWFLLCALGKNNVRARETHAGQRQHSDSTANISLSLPDRFWMKISVFTNHIGCNKVPQHCWILKSYCSQGVPKVCIHEGNKHFFSKLSSKMFHT